jgi:hypothetical protein
VIKEIKKVNEEIEMEEENEIDREIFKACEKIKDEFFKLLEQKHPPFVPLFQMYYEYIDEHYHLETRLDNAYKILRAYALLKL